MQIPNEQIEQLIVYKFLTDKNYTPLIEENYNSKYFDNKEIDALLQLMIAYYNKYNKIPDKIVLDPILTKYAETKSMQPKKLIDTLDICISNKINDEAFIKDNVLGFFKEKAVYFAIIESLDDIEKKKDVSKCIEKFQKANSVSLDYELGMGYFEDFDAHLEKMTAKESLISSGWRQMDHICSGGFPVDGRCLIVYMGQPGIGKSLMMSNQAVNFMKKGLWPLIVTFELSEQAYAKRIDAHISKFDMANLRNQTVKLKDKINFFKEAHNCQLTIKEYPPHSTTTHQLQSYIERLIQRKGKVPDVIMVDYINLMLPNTTSKNANLYERVGDISRDLRASSYYFTKPVISLTQMNRSGFNTSEVGMENVSESTGILHTADFLGAIWQQEGDREAGKMSMSVLKNRFGGYIGSVLDFQIDYNNLVISDNQTELTEITPQSKLITELENI